MQSGQRVALFRVIKLLGLAVAFAVIIFGVPALAMGSTAADKPLPEQPPLCTSDSDRRPTVVTDGGAEMAARRAMLDERRSLAGGGLQLATLPPYVFYDDVEAGAGSWTAQSPWAITDTWVPWWMDTNNSWTDSPGGNYANDANTSLTSQVFDLSNVGDYQYVDISFSYKSALEAEYIVDPIGGDYWQAYDYLYIEFSGDGGANWNYYGDYIWGYQDDGWFNAEVPHEMCTDQFRFRLRLDADEIITDDGVYIDNIALRPYSTDGMEETDPRVAYFGNWTTGSGTYYYDDGSSWTWYHKSTNTPGDLMQITFDGPAIELYGKVGPEYGIATISLDGGPVTTVDYYVDPEVDPYYYVYPYYIVGYDDLSDGPHTLTIGCSGTKNPDSTGYRVSFETAYIWGDGTTAASPPVHKEQVGPPASLYYEGPWTQAVADPNASGASLATVDAAGGSVNVEFKGTYLAWNAKKGPGFGQAKVSLDGGPLVPVDLYKSYNSSKQRVYNTGLLKGGIHTLSIYWTGSKNASATSTKINVDSFDLYDFLGDAEAASPLVNWRYQETDSRITYLGAWSDSGDTGWKASGNSFKSTAQLGAAAVIDFKGTEVTPVLRTAPWYGQARVTLDPGTTWEETQIIDLSSASVGWKVTSLYTKTGLDDIDHTLVIENISTDGKAIALDAVDMKAYLEQALVATKIDDNDYAHSTYTPGIATGASTTAWSRWDASGYWAAYQDTYAYTDKDDYEVTFTFEGMSASWVAATSNAKGKALVSLYNGPVDEVGTNLVSSATVDLYSPSTQWKRTVYTTGYLPESTYHLVIECLYEKNPASWWYTIDVDRFDILGGGV